MRASFPYQCLSCRILKKSRKIFLDAYRTEKSRRDHLAQVKPRKRRVSFGSISERLFLKDETAATAASAVHQSEETAMTTTSEDVYATVTGAGTSPPNASPPIDVPTIFFSHHGESEGAVVGAVGGRVPNDPSDFVRLYGAGSPTRLKSILKPSGSSHSLSSLTEEAALSPVPMTLSGRQDLFFNTHLEWLYKGHIF